MAGPGVGGRCHRLDHKYHQMDGTNGRPPLQTETRSGATGWSCCNAVFSPYRYNLRLRHQGRINPTKITIKTDFFYCQEVLGIVIMWIIPVPVTLDGKSNRNVEHEFAIGEVQLLILF